MQVVHPYPTVKNPSSSSGVSAFPASVTTFDPGEARLDPGLALEAALDGLLREEPGADHDSRVRGVRARSDAAMTTAPWPRWNVSPRT
jgi:hypothetical protein